MEQTIIKQRAAKLQTKEDLLNLLNDIVKDELGKEDAFSFSLKQISYFCNPNNIIIEVGFKSLLLINRDFICSIGNFCFNCI